MAPDHVASLAELLSGFEYDSSSPHPSVVQKAVYLARILQRRANELQTPQERRQQAELDRMIHNSADKATLTQMTDQAFRSRIPHRAVDQLIHILDLQGVPRFFSPWDRTMLKGFQTFGGYMPGVAVPFVKQRMHRETANVVLPAEWEMLSKHLGARAQEGVRMNVNYLGEAILSEEEAQRRLERYLEALQKPEIEVVSVKISTIYSQISPLARRHTIEQLCNRLELLFRAAAKGRYIHADGRVVPKFVYLDMEEYRDMALTSEAFMRTLDRRGLENVSAGIVLQAYIPDSYAVQKQIYAWARQRVAGGRAPITLRIVKGANMEMERVDASLHGWPQAPYKHKIETDANFKRMLHEAMVPENLNAVRLGVASHNLFELAYGLVLALEGNALQWVQFEMLEGMANHQRRALFEYARNVLLYAPACLKKDFIYAIGYLIRRLDENTGPENFLRYAFRLDVHSADWNMLESGFLESFKQVQTLSSTPRRLQDRRAPVRRFQMGQTGCFRPPSAEEPGGWNFINEPDTDFSLPQNAEWAEQIVKTWIGRCGDQAVEIPLVIAGDTVQGVRDILESSDPSRPGTVVARYQQATRQDVDAAMACAKDDPAGWRSLDSKQRNEILTQAANEIRVARAALMGAAMVDGGKTLLESDPEVSEAIDFVEFYARAADAFRTMPALQAQGRGVVVVVSPWNFPIAIPCGGVAAGLAAGNTVLLKPASDTVLVAHELCQCFWRGGVPREVLQLVPCSGGDVGSYLIAHKDVDVVILTGGTKTALQMLELKPTLNLLAETGGKNATIVTAMSDRDQAIKNVLHSAFSHAGQKCSATSLLILEEEVYHDAEFKQTLCDAVQSIPVGPAHELATRMGPLIRPPAGDLERAVKELEPGESWAVMPRQSSDNPNLYSPGVKWGVQPGSYTHLTEFFGPVLSVMQARDLDEAIHFANATGYGLTSGLESLDDREQRLWQQSIRAGNLYINRGTTGAIVLRQPFGGMAKSAFGPGIKAGGPNYVAQLMAFQETGDPEGIEITDPLVADLLQRLGASVEMEPGKIPQHGKRTISNHDFTSLRVAARSYAKYNAEEFSRASDNFRLVGQDNFRRYLPVQEMRIRVHPDDTPFELFARVIAAKTIGCRITVSYPPEIEFPYVDWLDHLTDPWAASIEFVEETDDELVQRIRNHQTDRLRYAASSRVPLSIRQAAPEVPLYIADTPIFRHGRIELLWYVREQSLCIDYHRYGNLGARADETRAEVL
ncbi:MAG: proline dehydrogenase family protein [Pirellulales bacterium]|nr:proline dehydrogenase family protein [Pirellulales bacterium]